MATRKLSALLGTRLYNKHFQLSHSLAYRPLPSTTRGLNGLSHGLHSSALNGATEGGLTVKRPATTPPLGSISVTSPSRVQITIDEKTLEFSPHLLRDACECHRCVHETSNQRLFSQADIPANLQARSVEVDDISDTVSIQWADDCPTFSTDHVTTLNLQNLRNIATSGTQSSSADIQEPQKLWPLAPSEIPDFNYEAYMNDDETLYTVLRQLRIHGLAFVTNSPQNEESVSAIATRIGPIKDTFYGRTWDVRTVPQAINAAYTSSDLGFHTDLLYFEQPPHIQLLHCVQSASDGGASVFTDAHRAAVDLFKEHFDAFKVLAETPVNYHYNHPNDNVYSTTKPVIGLKPLRVGKTTFDSIEDYMRACSSRSIEWTEQMLVDCLDKCNWGLPPSLWTRPPRKTLNLMSKICLMR